MDGTLTAAAWRRLLDLAAAARRMRDAGTPPGTDPASGVRAIVEAGDVLTAATDHDLASLYLDLIAATARRPVALAQLGQSLDGRIATESGHSQYINGAESLDHLHRLRALVDAVVVGATTVALDDPRLTTRRVEGPSPTRVILDPRGRLSARARVFDGSAPTLVVTGGRPDQRAEHPAAARGVPVVRLPAPDGRIPPAAILACLHQRRLATVLIEGGAHTISAFLAAGCLDRMMVAVAPMLIGSGTAAVCLPPIGRVDEAIRFAMRAYRLGSDVVFDCVLRDGGGGESG
ncbi:MAG: RibD family protein [Rhodospirillales bacterium]